MAVNQKKVGVALSYLSILLSNSISLIYTPFMLNMMGQSEYGLFGTANSYISYLTLLSFGIGGAYIRYNSQYRVAKDIDGEQRLNGMFFTIFTVMAGLVAIGGVGIAIFTNQFLQSSFTSDQLEKLTIIIFLMTVNTVFSFLFNVVMMALQSYEKFIFLRICAIISGILTPVINVIVLLKGGKSVAITVSSLSVATIIFIMYYVYAKRSIRLKFKFGKFDRKIMRSILVFSSFLFINSITDQLTFSTDNIVLSKLFGATGVAVYVVGSNFKSYFMSFSSTVSSVFASQINLIVARKDDHAELDHLFIKVGRVQCIIESLILIGYIFIGQDFIRLWAGENYDDSYLIGLLLMLAIYIPCFQNVGIEIQKAKNMHKMRSIVYFVVAVVNVLLTIPFSIVAGGVGAAFATMICLFGGSVVFMNIYYQKKVGLNIKRFWKQIFRLYPGMLPSILVGFLFEKFYVCNSFVDILLGVVMISASYFIFVWLFSLNKEEKNMISNPIKRHIKKGKGKMNDKDWR